MPDDSVVKVLGNIQRQLEQHNERAEQRHKETSESLCRINSAMFGPEDADGVPQQHRGVLMQVRELRAAHAGAKKIIWFLVITILGLTANALKRVIGGHD